jgi:hypothetical protein
MTSTGEISTTQWTGKHRAVAVVGVHNATNALDLQ